MASPHTEAAHFHTLPSADVKDALFRRLTLFIHPPTRQQLWAQPVGGNHLFPIHSLGLEHFRIEGLGAGGGRGIFLPSTRVQVTISCKVAPQNPLLSHADQRPWILSILRHCK